jgi:hypothetical protein
MPATLIHQRAVDMKLPIWLFLTWEWLKRNWKWLLLPLGVLFWFLGRVTAKKKVTITSTALAEADSAKVAIDEKAEAQRELADAKEATQLAGIASRQAAAVTAATQAQVGAAAAAQGDPEQVNALLQAVSKDLRRN